jgi:hypothetical protein
MRRRRKAVQEQNGGSISGTGFAIEDIQPLHVKRAIENGRCNSKFHGIVSSVICLFAGNVAGMESLFAT